MFKGIIFDLDGTLLDTVATIAYYGNKTLARYEFAPIETLPASASPACGKI